MHIDIDQGMLLQWASSNYGGRERHCIRFRSSKSIRISRSRFAYLEVDSHISNSIRISRTRFAYLQLDSHTSNSIGFAAKAIRLSRTRFAYLELDSPISNSIRIYRTRLADCKGDSPISNSICIYRMRLADRKVDSPILNIISISKSIHLSLTRLACVEVDLRSTNCKRDQSRSELDLARILITV